MKKEYKTVIVEPTACFSYMDPFNGQRVSHNRPSVVVVTGFIEGLLANSCLRVLVPNLPKEANDKEFLEYYKECDKDKEFALASYASKFGVNELGIESPDAKKRSAKITRAAIAAEKKLLAEKE